MELIKADHQGKLLLAGVPEPVSRPVDIDRLQTGFAVLRSLRIYCFNAGSVIDGHAEDDEVLIIILAGSVHLTMSQHEVEESSPQFSLSAVGNTNRDSCVAYLPPNGAYRLVPVTNAEVAYARATTSEAREPKVFASTMQTERAVESILFEEASYPAHLRLRIAQVKSTDDTLSVIPMDPSDLTCESLLHVRSQPEHGALTISGANLQPLALQSWNTVSVSPGERPALHLAPASSALLLVVLASV